MTGSAASPEKRNALSVFGPRRICLLFFALLACSTVVRAEEIQIAVASNFRAPMEDLVEHFEARTPHKVVWPDWWEANSWVEPYKSRAVPSTLSTARDS